MSEHNPVARYCQVITTPPLPPHLLSDTERCEACDELSALVDLDPDFGSKEDGRPWIGGRDDRP